MKTNKMKKTLAIQKTAVQKLYQIIGELRAIGVKPSLLHEGDLISLLIQKEDALQFLQDTLTNP